MDNLVVFVKYPPEFLSYEKFRRKIDFILSKTENFSLVFEEDPNNFVRIYSGERNLSFVEISDFLNSNGFSHAILFEDRDSYKHLKISLSDRNIPTRVVPLKLTLVVNRDKGDNYDLYIGRGSVWGNPYRIGHDGDRGEVIRKYEYDFDRKFLRAFENFEKNSEDVRGKVLGCHCKPYACHGDIIAKFFNSIDDGM